MADSVIAVFADIHSNIEALRAVLDDMDTFSLRRRYCLGDIVGYAANPAQCLELIRSLGCPVVIGNHDSAVSDDAAFQMMRDTAKAGMEFARQKLSREQSNYLESLPLVFSEENTEFVHSSLKSPSEWHYVLHASEAAENFEAQTKPICFCGHTHIPAVWHLDSGGRIKSWKGRGRITLPADGKILINVGSVGQPRDLCAEACYVLCDPIARWVQFRRVPYDLQKTKRKIMRAKLPRFTAQRLALGR